jgi:DNA polymerase (family 10)
LRRHLLGEILPEAESILDQFAGLTVTRKISLAGSIRRRKETIGDVDILATSPEPEKIMSVLVSLQEVDRIIGQGPTKSTVLLKSGIQVDLRVVKEDEYWTALIYFTGSKDHTIALRRRALERNWHLNEYGLVDLATAKNFRSGVNGISMPISASRISSPSSGSALERSRRAPCRHSSRTTR